MWKAFSGRSESGSTSGLRRKKSGSGRAAASDAGVSSTSRRDEEGRRTHKSSRSAYGDDDGKSSASVYATAPSSGVGSNSARTLTESAVRALASQDDDWEDDDRAKSEKRSRRGEGSEKRHKSSRTEKERSRSRERKERPRQSASYTDSGRSERSHGKSRVEDVVDGTGERAIPAMGSFEQFPGQYSAALVGPVQPHGPIMSGALPSADPAHQFPAQIPSTYDRPQMGPTRADSFGAAADYYLDEGQSVHTQPGHRAQTPNMLVNPDLFLMAASAKPHPAEDTGHGSAADFYGGKVSPIPKQTTKTTSSSSQRPASGRQPSESSSRPSKVGPLMSTAAAAAATADVLGAAGSSHHSQQQTSSTSSYQQASSSSRPQIKPTRRSPEPSFAANGAAGSYYAPAPQQTPLSQGIPGRQPSITNSNVPLYAAGAAAAGVAAYGMSQHQQQTSSQMNSASYYGDGGGQGPRRPPFRPGDGSYANGDGGMQSHYHYHEHKEPMTRLKDGFLNLISDPEDVRRMEEYTEYIGVCKFCFDPRSTPYDGPRQHHFHRRPSQDSFEELRRRKSYERMQRKGSSETMRRRVDKESRYYSSDRDKRRHSSKADMVGVGLAAASVAAGPSALYNDRKDFDDTYSVKSGHRASSAMRRRSRSSSRERRRRSEHGVIRAEPPEEYVTVRTRDGRVEKRRVLHRERSRSRERRNGLMGAAAGAAVGAAAGSVIAGDSRHRHESKSQGASVHHHSRSRSRSHSPGLGQIFGFSGSTPAHSGRRSPNGSYHEISRRERRSSGEQSGMLSSFFSPSQNERKQRRHGREHRKKQKGFFSLGNVSSSSSDDDMAFGDGFASKTSLPLRRKKSARTVRKRSDDHLAATVAGIGVTAAALAAAQNRNRISKRTSRPELGARRNVRVQHDGHHGPVQVDEDGWEDELPSDVDDASSTHSGLAFGDGSQLSHRQSMESVSSGDGLSAWGWRWGGKDRKHRRRPSSPGPKYPPRPSESYIGPVGAGLAAGVVASTALDAAGRPFGPDSRVTSTTSVPQQPMQYVDPRPMSDAGSRHGSMPGGFEPPATRPGPAPLQQPQPIAPVSPAFVQDTFMDERPKPRRTASSPTRSSFGLQDAALIGAGALAAGSVIASQGRKSKESSNVRFGLTDEQQRKEDRQRRREREEADEERRRADRTRALKEEAERHAKEEDARRREEEVRRRREDENRVAAEAALERQRAVQREAEQQAELDRERKERDRREQQEVYEREQRRLADEAQQQEQNRRQWESTAVEEAAREKEARVQRAAQIQAEIEAKQRELDQQALQRRRVEEARRERERLEEEEALERRRVKNTPRERGLQDSGRSRHSSTAGGPGAAGAVAAATVGAVLAGFEHGRHREVDHDKERDHEFYPEQQALHHPIEDVKPTSYAAKQVLPGHETSGSPIMADDLFDKDFFKRKRSDSEYARHADQARKAADKVVADMDAYYQQPAPSQADFFAPKDVLSQPSAGKTKVADPYDDNDVQVYRSADEATGSHHEEVGGRSRHAPYGVPSLNVICPTPPPSAPISVKGYGSRPHSPLVQETDAEPSTAERPSKRDRSRSISWGEDKTHVYDPPTPESYQERDSYMQARDIPVEPAAAAGAALDEIVVEAAEPGQETKKTSYKAEEMPQQARMSRVDEGVEDLRGGIPSSHRQPFYDSMSDLGFGRFGVDSPGTEGASAVRGFVEGETNEPTPVEEKTAHMPGAFEDDKDMGPIRRSDEIGGSIEPEVSVWEPPLSKKDKKKRDKASKRATTFDSEPSEPSTPRPADVPLPSYETAEPPQEEPAEYYVSKKDKKKRDKASKRAAPFGSEPSEPSTPAVVEVELPDSGPAGTLQEEQDDYFMSKKDKKKRDKALKRGLSDFSSPIVPETKRTEVIEDSLSTEVTASEPDAPKLSKKEQKKREKDSKLNDLTAVTATAVATGGIAALADSPTAEPEEDWTPSGKKGKKGKKKGKESERDIRDIGPSDQAADALPADEEPSAMPGGWSTETPTELPDPFQYQIKDDEPSPTQETDPFADFSTGKSKKKKKKRESSRFNEPAASSPLRSEWKDDDYIGSQTVDQGEKAPVGESPFTAEPASYTNGDRRVLDDSYYSGAGAAPMVTEPEQASYDRAERGPEYRNDDRRTSDFTSQQAMPPASADSSAMAPEAERASEDRAERGPECEDDDRRVSDARLYESPEDGRSRSVVSGPASDRDARRMSKSGKARSEVGFADEADNYDNRSVTASEPIDYYDSFKKSRHRSKHEDDDASSVVSSRSRREKGESSVAKKEKKGSLFGLFSRKSSDAVPLSRQSTHSDEAPLSRTSTHHGDQEDGECKHRRRKHREGSVYDDEDDTRSVTSESKHRHRHDRNERENGSTDKRRPSRHDGDNLDTRSEPGHSSHHRSEYDDDDTVSRAGTEGGHRHHHHRRRTDEYADNSKDQSFLGDRVEDLPPLPVSPPESPVLAPAKKEQDHGTPASAEPDTHPAVQGRETALELAESTAARELPQTNPQAQSIHAKVGAEAEADRLLPSIVSRPGAPVDHHSQSRRTRTGSLSEMLIPSAHDDLQYLPALPTSRPVSPILEALPPVSDRSTLHAEPGLSSQAEELPALPTSRPGSPIETPDRPAPLARPTSTTAIPLRFPFGHPRSPQKERSASFGSPLASSPASPSSTHKKLRPSSTEFRPLYLVERNRKPQEVEDTLPSLPSSKPSSRASSIQGSEDWHSAAEDPPSPEREKRLTIDIDHANNYQYDDEYLDSEQATPKASEFPPTALERPARQAPQFYTWDDFEQDERLHGYEGEHAGQHEMGRKEVADVASGPSSSQPELRESNHLPGLPDSQSGSTYEPNMMQDMKAGRSAKAIAAAAMLGGAAVLSHRAFDSQKDSSPERDSVKLSHADTKDASTSRYPLPATTFDDEERVKAAPENEQEWPTGSRKPLKKQSRGDRASPQTEVQIPASDDLRRPELDNMPALKPIETDDFLATERSVEEGDAADATMAYQSHSDRHPQDVFPNERGGVVNLPLEHSKTSTFRGADRIAEEGGSVDTAMDTSQPESFGFARNTELRQDPHDKQSILPVNYDEEGKQALFGPLKHVRMDDFVAAECRAEEGSADGTIFETSPIKRDHHRDSDQWEERTPDAAEHPSFGCPDPFEHAIEPSHLTKQRTFDTEELDTASPRSSDYGMKGAEATEPEEAFNEDQRPSTPLTRKQSKKAKKRERVAASLTSDQPSSQDADSINRPASPKLEDAGPTGFREAGEESVHAVVSPRVTDADAMDSSLSPPHNVTSTPKDVALPETADGDLPQSRDTSEMPDVQMPITAQLTDSLDQPEYSVIGRGTPGEDMMRAATDETASQKYVGAVREEAVPGLADAGSEELQAMEASTMALPKLRGLSPEERLADVIVPTLEEDDPINDQPDEGFWQPLSKKTKKGKKGKKSTVVDSEPSTPLEEAAAPARPVDLPDSVPAEAPDEPDESFWAPSSKKRGKKGKKGLTSDSGPSTPVGDKAARSELREPATPSADPEQLPDITTIEAPVEQPDAFWTPPSKKKGKKGKKAAQSVATSLVEEETPSEPVRDVSIHGLQETESFEMAAQDEQLPPSVTATEESPDGDVERSPLTSSKKGKKAKKAQQIPPSDDGDVSTVADAASSANADRGTDADAVLESSSHPPMQSDTDTYGHEEDLQHAAEAQQLSNAETDTQNISAPGSSGRENKKGKKAKRVASSEPTEASEPRSKLSPRHEAVDDLQPDSQDEPSQQTKHFGLDSVDQDHTPDGAEKNTVPIPALKGLPEEAHGAHGGANYTGTVAEQDTAAQGHVSDRLESEKTSELSIAEHNETGTAVSDPLGAGVERDHNDGMPAEAAVRDAPQPLPVFDREPDATPTSPYRPGSILTPGNSPDHEASETMLHEGIPRINDDAGREEGKKGKKGKRTVATLESAREVVPRPDGVQVPPNFEMSAPGSNADRQDDVNEDWTGFTSSKQKKKSKRAQKAWIDASFDLPDASPEDFTLESPASTSLPESEDGTGLTQVPAVELPGVSLVHAGGATDADVTVPSDREHIGAVLPHELYSDADLYTGTNMETQPSQSGNDPPSSGAPEPREYETAFTTPIEHPVVARYADISDAGPTVAEQTNLRTAATERPPSKSHFDEGEEQREEDFSPLPESPDTLPVQDSRAGAIDHSHVSPAFAEMERIPFDEETAADATTSFLASKKSKKGKKATASADESWMESSAEESVTTAPADLNAEHASHNAAAWAAGAAALATVAAHQGTEHTAANDMFDGPRVPTKQSKKDKRKAKQGEISMPLDDETEGQSAIVPETRGLEALPPTPEPIVQRDSEGEMRRLSTRGPLDAPAEDLLQLPGDGTADESAHETMAEGKPVEDAEWPAFATKRSEKEKRRAKKGAISEVLDDEAETSSAFEPKVAREEATQIFPEPGALLEDDEQMPNAPSSISPVAPMSDNTQAPGDESAKVDLSEGQALEQQPVSATEWPTFTKRSNRERRKRSSGFGSPAVGDEPILKADTNIDKSQKSSTLRDIRSDTARSLQSEPGAVTDAVDQSVVERDASQAVEESTPGPEEEWPATFSTKRSKRDKKKAKKGGFEQFAAASEPATTSTTSFGADSVDRVVDDIVPETDSAATGPEASIPVPDAVTNTVNPQSHESPADADAESRGVEPTSPTAEEGPTFSTKRSKKDKRKSKQAGLSQRTEFVEAVATTPPAASSSSKGLHDGHGADVQKSGSPVNDFAHDDDAVTPTFARSPDRPVPWEDARHPLNREEVEISMSAVPPAVVPDDTSPAFTDNKAQSFSHYTAGNDFLALDERQAPTAERNGPTLNLGEAFAHGQYANSNASQQPGQDIDFAATLAAGLADTGFDPDLVINDAAFHRRASPPGTLPEVPEEVFTTTSKRKKRAKKLGPSWAPDELAEAPVDQAEGGRHQATGEASLPPLPVDDFDVDVSNSLQQSGFDPTLLERAISSHGTTSNDVTEDDARISFATARRRREGKKGKAIAGADASGLVSVESSGTGPEVVPASPSKFEREDPREPEFDTQATLQHENVDPAAIDHATTGPSISPGSSIPIVPAIDQAEQAPGTAESDVPASAATIISVDRAHTFNVAGDRELDMDEMDKAYSAFKKKERRKKKKQKAVAEEVDRSTAPSSFAQHSDTATTDGDVPSLGANFNGDAATSGEAPTMRGDTRASTESIVESPSSPSDTSRKVHSVFPGLARIKRRAPSVTSPTGNRADGQIGGPSGLLHTSEVSQSVLVPVGTTASPSEEIVRDPPHSLVAKERLEDQRPSPYDQQPHELDLTHNATLAAAGLAAAAAIGAGTTNRGFADLREHDGHDSPPGRDKTSSRDLGHDKHAENSGGPEWSFAALDSPQVQPESPVLGIKQHVIARDSGYQEASSPILNRRSGGNTFPDTPEVRMAASHESLRSRRSAEPLHIATDTVPDWQLNLPKERTTNEAPEQVRVQSRTPSREIVETPLESTTKDRASYLFQSPPANLRGISDTLSRPTHEREAGVSDYFAHAGSQPQPTSAHESPPGPSTDRSAFSPPPPGPLSPRAPLAVIPEEPNAAKRSKDDADVGGPAMVKAICRTETPQAIRNSKQRALSPVRPTVTIPTNSTRLASNPLSTDDLIQRMSWPAVDEDHGTVNINRSLKPRTSKPALPEPRSASAMSNRSSGSAAQHLKSPADLRSFSRSSNRSSTSTLRRIDRSLSGDLRAASRRGDAAVGVSRSPKTIPFEAPPTPPSNDEDVIIAGAAGAAVMADVFQGYGDAQGSQVSPTRPPSVRKRQSMHITDLESKLDQLVAENRALQDAKQDVEQSHEATSYQQDVNSQAMREALETRDLRLREKEVEIHRIQAMLQPLREEIDRLNEINGGLTEANRNLVDDTNGRYATLQAEHAQAHEQWQNTSRDLELSRQEQSHITSTMRDTIATQIATALADKNAEIGRLREELDVATEQIRALQVQIQSSKSTEFLTVRDEDYFDGGCQKLCQHVQQWVLRFSKLSDNRVCRLSTELRNDKFENRLDNAILDGSDVDKLLGDRIRRRDVFMSVVMTMVWEYVFTRYLFGMDREQRQKLKALEKILAEVGPPRAIAQWRATTLTLLSKRPDFARQCALDTEAVAHEVFALLTALLPPPSNAEQQLLASLQKVISVAADLTIEMRTQRAEYIMLPPLQPEYDTNGDLVRKVHFNASLMNERSGLFSSNEGLEQERAVVKIVLFPLVVKKGDEFGQGEEEIVVCPAQVLVHHDGGKGKKVVRVMSGAMEIDDPRRSRQSPISTAPGSAAF